MLAQLPLSMRHHVAHQLDLFSSFCSFCSLGISVATGNLFVPTRSRQHHEGGMSAFAPGMGNNIAGQEHQGIWVCTTQNALMSSSLAGLGSSLAPAGGRSLCLLC